MTLLSSLIDVLAFFLCFDLWLAIARGRLKDTERARFPYYFAISIIGSIIPTAITAGIADPNMGYIPSGIGDRLA